MSIQLIGDGIHGAIYLPEFQALVTVTPSKDIFSKPDADPLKLILGEKDIKKIIPWGASNNLPNIIIDKVAVNETLSAGMYFNSYAGYGDGIMPCYYEYDKNGSKKVFPYEYLGDYLKQQETENADPEVTKTLKKRMKIWESTWKEWQEFQSNNDVGYYLLDQLIDLNYLNISFAEFILNRDKKIVLLNSKEACFSRLEQKDPKTGKINNHFYSSKWNENTGQAPKKEDINITPLIDWHNPIRDFKIILGLIQDGKGDKSKIDSYRFILPIRLPSPAKQYYPKSPWHAVFESGWYDLMIKIPILKKALVENQMTIKYHIELDANYFEDIFKEERITEDDKKKARIILEYQNMNDFLSNASNSGKSVISFVTYTPDGKEKRKMKITVIENHFKGGEYIEDSEEAGNVLNYAMGVHPSLVGSSPGKTKTINGTEARELYQIKQSLLKPIRDRVLIPFYVIKEINGWDPALQFTIPNIQLTTLDTGKQTEKIVS